MATALVANNISVFSVSAEDYKNMTPCPAVSKNSLSKMFARGFSSVIPTTTAAPDHVIPGKSKEVPMETPKELPEVVMEPEEKKARVSEGNNKRITREEAHRLFGELLDKIYN